MRVHPRFDQRIERGFGLGRILADQGTGIAPDVIEKVFEPFFTTKDIGQGTGLGLSVTYGIIKEHGGEIRVESGQGRFTRFIISLPLSRPVAERNSGGIRL